MKRGPPQHSRVYIFFSLAPRTEGVECLSPGVTVGQGLSLSLVSVRSSPVSPQRWVTLLKRGCSDRTFELGDVLKNRMSFADTSKYICTVIFKRHSLVICIVQRANFLIIWMFSFFDNEIKTYRKEKKNMLLLKDVGFSFPFYT